MADENNAALRAELEALKQDMNRLSSTTGNATREKLTEWRDRAGAGLNRAGSQAANMVCERPATTLFGAAAIGAAVGAAVSMLCCQRD